MSSRSILTLMMLAGLPMAATGWVFPDLPSSVARQNHPTLLKDTDPIFPTTSKPASGTGLTDDDLRNMWHLDDRRNDVHRRAESRREVYTDTDRSQLWHLENDLGKKSDGTTDSQAYTDRERAQLWHLQEVDKEIRNRNKYNRNTYTHKDRARLWGLDDGSKRLKDETKRQSYSSQERAELWHLDEYSKLLDQELAFKSHFSVQDVAELWHLDDHSKMRDEKGKDHETYTNLDRQKLWNLEDSSTMRHSEEWQPYTNQERVPTLRVEDPRKIRHEDMDRYVYSSQDRSDLWNLKDLRIEGNHGPSVPYTAKDRQELWALSVGEQKWVQRSTSNPMATVYDPFYHERGVHSLL